MNDSYDPLVCIHVMNTWVQLALSDALCKIADNIEREVMPLKTTIDAFEDVMHCYAPDIEGYYPRNHEARTSTAPLAEIDTTSEEFVADAVLARLGLDATTGPLLLGASRWIAVHNRFKDVFASDMKDSPIAGECSKDDDAAELVANAPPRSPRLAWFKWISKFCSSNSKEGDDMDYQDEIPVEEAEIWIARAAPAHPAVTTLSGDAPMPSQSTPPSAVSTESCSPDKPRAQRTKAKRRGVPVCPLRRETRGVHSRKE
jgi:hypothetical protein